MKSYSIKYFDSSASSNGTRFTSFNPFSSISFALFSIHFVTSSFAGPPFAALYLKPPSSGGLCEGVTTIPSVSSCVRIAFEITGVGVYLKL